jgi:hypothetical protein
MPNLDWEERGRLVETLMSRVGVSKKLTEQLLSALIVWNMMRELKSLHTRTDPARPVASLTPPNCLSKPARLQTLPFGWASSISIRLPTQRLFQEEVTW